MPFRLSDAFDRAADVLNDSYSEANEYGDVIPLRYLDPRHPLGEPHEWPVVMGEVEYQPVYDATTGEESIRITRLAEVRTPIVTASGITGFQSDALFEWDGEQWHLNEAESVWDAEFVTFGLSREPLIDMGTVRSVDV